MILAGPGSGKTTVVTNRILNMIDNCKVNPENILVITFTRMAALQMKERFLKLASESDVHDNAELYDDVTFGTFHAVFFMVLKYAYHFESSNIVTEEQRYQFMREIISYHHLEYQDENEFIGEILGEISKVKNERIPLDHFYSSHCGEEIFRKIYTASVSYTHLTLPTT